MADCATDPALGIEAASADVQLLQSRSALPQAKPCSNRVVTTRRQPVVTTRKLHQRTCARLGLPQVAAPSDGLTAGFCQRDGYTALTRSGMATPITS
jgi:hypothetical protein